MKKIWQYLKTHVEADFHLGYYIGVFAFLASCIFINYHFNFYKSYLSPQQGLFKFLCYCLFYTSSYFIAVLGYLFCYKKQHLLRTRNFWIKSLIIIVVLSFDHSAPFLRPFVNAYLPDEILLWGFKVLNNISSLFTVIIPIIIFYFINERHENHVYGLQPKQFDIKPYFVMLLLMIPLIIGASFNESFLRQYPMYKLSQAHEYLQVPEWFTVAVYELAYALDFITVEFMFRGFMVIGMIQVLGRGSVITMAVAYCFLHFGKPAGEAISSIFGGYLLGAIAYETKSVWGGIIVHIGIAWGMELTAFAQKHL